MYRQLIVLHLQILQSVDFERFQCGEVWMERVDLKHEDIAIIKVTVHWIPVIESVHFAKRVCVVLVTIRPATTSVPIQSERNKISKNVWI